MERICENCLAAVDDAAWLVMLSRPETGAGRGEDGDGLGNEYKWCIHCAIEILTDE